jgi:hypothetical protein
MIGNSVCRADTPNPTQFSTDCNRNQRPSILPSTLSESQRIYKNSFDNAAEPWFDLVDPLKTVTKAGMLKRWREATGMGWLQAKLFFAWRSDELCEKILRAHQEQT